MDRDQKAVSLKDQEDKTISEVLEAFHRLILVATDRITNKASTGRAAHNSMAMQLETQRLIKGVETLHALTRRIRELWVVGPLRAQDEDTQQLHATINAEVQTITDMLNQLRQNNRQQLVSAGGGYGQYVVGPLAQPSPTPNVAAAQPSRPPA